MVGLLKSFLLKKENIMTTFKSLLASMVAVMLMTSVHASEKKKVAFRSYASVIQNRAGKKAKHVKVKKGAAGKKAKVAATRKQVKRKQQKKAKAPVAKPKQPKKRPQPKTQKVKRKALVAKAAGKKITKPAPKKRIKAQPKKKAPQKPVRGKPSKRTKKPGKKLAANEFQVRKFGTVIRVIEGADITNQPDADAIVNAANETLIGSAGIAKAIQDQAGPDLIEYIESLPEQNGVRCVTGSAVITPAFNLPNRWIIHAVGPRGSNPDRNALLQYVYGSILQEALQENVQIIAIPSISTGIFGFPIQEAAQIAVQETINFLKQHRGRIKEVRFIVWGQDNFNYYRHYLGSLK